MILPEMTEPGSTASSDCCAVDRAGAEPTGALLPMAEGLEIGGDFRDGRFPGWGGGGLRGSGAAPGVDVDAADVLGKGGCGR